MYIQSMLGGSSSPTREKLYENTNASQSFQGTDITFINSRKISDYDHIEIKYYGSYYQTTLYPVVFDSDFYSQGESYKMAYCMWLIGPAKQYFRLVKFLSDYSLHINDCFEYGSTTKANNYLIPWTIYGIKD